MRFCYVIAPYRGDVSRNVEYARELGRQVAERGYVPIIPHNMSTGIEDIGNDEYWLDVTMALLLRCDAYTVAYNWEKSEGCKAEVARATHEGLELVRL